MLSIFDPNVHDAGESFQVIRAGIRDYRDAQTLFAAGHGTAVLEDERAFAAVELAGYTFDGDVSGGSLDVGPCAKHLARTRRLQISMEFLVD